MSFSSAPAHMGRFCERQNARLHCVHEEDADRASSALFSTRSVCCFSLSRFSSLSGSVAGDEVGATSGDDVGEAGWSLGGWTWGGEESPPLAGPRRIMVLFLKQVHLQNVGAAATLLAKLGSVREEYLS